MNVRTPFFLAFALCAGLLSAAEPEYQLKQVEELPKELADPVAGVLDAKGYQVAAGGDQLIEIWLAKDLEVKPEFQPTFTAKYPFRVGQLVGAVRVAEDGKLSDFRGQDIPAGVYTLRYGQQPSDGNHLGTAETGDFLLLLPAEEDKTPTLIRFAKQLQEKSAKAAGSEHPAVLWLAPPEEEAGAAALVHDSDKDFWIFNVAADAEGDAQVPLRLVVVGKSEG